MDADAQEEFYSMAASTRWRAEALEEARRILRARYPNYDTQEVFYDNVHNDKR